MLIAVDPGDTSGICIFNDDSSVKKMMQLNLEEFTKWAATYDGPVDTIVYEKFIVFRQKAHTQVGSTMKVSQAVGMLKMMAHSTGAKLVEQGPDIKKIAIKWSGIIMPSQHSQTHKWDAFLHGYYYLVKEGKIKHDLEGF